MVSLTSNPKTSLTVRYVDIPVVDVFCNVSINSVVFWFTKIFLTPSNCEREIVDIPEITTTSPVIKLWINEVIPTIWFEVFSFE